MSRPADGILAPAARPGLLWPAVAALLAFVVLAGLGTWQMQRLAWKEKILAQIDERIHAAPVPIPPEADWPTLAADDYEYRRVTVSGVLEHDKEALVFRPQANGAGDLGPGYLVMTPLRLTSGTHVIVDRGFVPTAKRDPAARAAGEVAGTVTITGLMRGPESRNVFTPADDPGRGQWYTRDPAVIAAHFRLERSAPFTIDADATQVPGGWPKGGQTLIDIPNNHLAYALTWYGFAATLAAVFAAFALSRRRHAAM